MSDDGKSALQGEEGPPPGVRAAALVRWGLVLLMALAATAAAVSYFGVFAHEGAGAATKQYYCPMHPSIVQDHPGECPICGMTLVEKSGGAAAPAPMPPPAPDGGEFAKLVPVELTPERIQLLGMRTARVTREALLPEIRTVGLVQPSEQGLAQVTTRFSGWIEQLFAEKTGERVSRGQPLASIYGPDLLLAQQEFLNAQKWAGGAGLLADARRRLELLGISPQEIGAIERSGQPQRSLVLRSSVDGYVIRKNALLGSFVQPGTVLYEVADLSTIWVIAEVYEYEADRVRAGQPARLQVTAYPGEDFPGRVEFIYPTVSTDTRTLRVRLIFKNPRLWLRPGMFATVFITLQPAEGLVVPAEAVVDTGDSQYLFVALPGGRFTPRRTRLGFRAGGKAQVLEGVSEGEMVVTTANFLIDSESRLRAAIGAWH